MSQSRHDEGGALTRQCFSNMRFSHPGRVIPFGHLGILALSLLAAACHTSDMEALIR